MIILTESEQKDLMSYYLKFKIDEESVVQSDWVSRKFPSTGRVCRCIELEDGSVLIKQVADY